MATIRKRAKKDGSFSYYAEIRIKRDGEVVHRESKTWPKKKLAEHWGAKREAELNEPGVLDDILSGQSTTSRMLVSQLIDEYIAAVYPLRPWQKTKSAVLEQLKYSEFGGLVASEVLAADIIDHCRGWGAGPSTTMQHVQYIKSVLSVAEELFRVPVKMDEVDKAHQVMSRLKIIGSSEDRERRPTIEEINRLVGLAWKKRMALKGGNRKYRGVLMPMDKIIAFAMFSSRRQGEIVRLTRSGTDFQNKRVLVPDMKHPTKKIGNDVWVSVPEEAWRVLMSVPEIEGEDRYFPNSSRSVGTRFNTLLKEAGLFGEDNLWFHDLRHECTSWLFERDGWQGERWGVSRVAAVTGHRDWSSLRRYTQVDRIEPYNKWENWEWLDRVCEN